MECRYVSDNRTEPARGLGSRDVSATHRKSRLVHILRSNCVLFAVLAIAAACIAHRISLGEFHLNFDESLHAMSGYFFLDFARDLRSRTRYATLSSTMLITLRSAGLFIGLRSSIFARR